ncbi:Crp/Fnr family transcriptional regulator [Algoriphagus confluentis]|uniref:Crp/Fnr family transcriptional regulator n=1 Tax=Algoriphagus confluentis TaxID=1697556 RepID=A0ABQ6PTZ4_9BACT|nr:Crp/Fnr family transcriptional regulator [Algoriphagus confluentis]
MITGEKKLKSYLSSFGILSDDQIERFVQLAKVKSLAKGDYFIRQGQICKEICFVISGILRSYHVSSKGNEFTYCFTFPSTLMTAYSSFITQEETLENIQAIAPVEFLLISKAAFEELVNENSEWQAFLKMVAEREYVALERRFFKFQQETGQERYEDLVQQQPDFFHHIPLQYLASYLGITQRHLSRIRAQFQK